MGELATEHAQQYAWARVAGEIAGLYDTLILANRGAACSCS